MQSPIKTRFIFAKKQNPEMCYNPKPIEYSFYQICSYPEDGFFNVRKLIYNQNFELIKTYEKEYPKKKIDKFLKITPKQKYQLYPTMKLNLVAHPNPDQIISANSNLLK